MATNLTTEARAGYAGGDNPYLFSSASWMAFRAGQEVGSMSGVLTCHKSRGYSVRIVTYGGNTVLVTFKGKLLDQVTVDRS